MSFNGSGTFSINTPGQPVVAGTAIAATYFNDLTADLATGLSTALLKDGTQTVTANIPMSGFKMTGLGAGTVATDAANISNVQGGTFSALGTVAGTNTITAAASPAILAYATGQLFRFVPANTNTGATTLNINSVAAKNIFWNNAACVGGELQQNVPVEVYYDGTQFQLVASGAMLNGFSVPTNVLHLQDSSDRTKQAIFSLAGLTTATTRTLTLPDANITLARIDAAQTFAGNQSFAGLIDASGVAAGQIKFPANENASANFNTLDDYQEAVPWTPTDASGASLSLTVVAADCIAYKIGRWVFIFFDVTYPSTGNGANALIGGLPYAAQGLTNSMATGVLFIGSSTTNINVIVTNNAATFTIAQGATARTNSSLSTSTVRGSFMYIAGA